MKTKAAVVDDYRKQNLRRFIESRVQSHGGWRAFARVCGQDYQKIKKWADSGNPTLESLIQLCDAIGISLSELATYIEGSEVKRPGGLTLNDSNGKRNVPVHTLQKLVATEVRRRGRQQFLEDSGITEQDLLAIEQGSLEGADLASVVGCLSGVLPYTYEELAEIILESSQDCTDCKSLEDSCY